MLKYKILCFLSFIGAGTLFAQKEYNYEDKYVIINSDSVGNTFCKTRTQKGKEIYVLNSRYKIKKEQRSWLGSDSDFMFTFYIIPNRNELKLEEIKDSTTITSYRVKNLINLSANLSSAPYMDLFEFIPILKIDKRYFKFANCTIKGQAFSILENSQYFPKYGATSNKYELNLLSKPYSKPQIDSLRKIIIKDTTAMVDFAVGVEDFYDKWFINKIDKQNKIFDFWIELKPFSVELESPSSTAYTFGRPNRGITYKVNIGVIGFKMIPTSPEFSKDYIDDSYSSVDFKFVDFIDLKKLQR